MVAGSKARLIPVLFSILAMVLIGCSDDDKATDNNGNGTPVDDSTLVADHVSADGFASIPLAAFGQIRAAFDIFYGHTSHGSQVVTGLGMLAAEHDSCALPTIHEYADDLGALGDTTWVPPTRSWLNTHPECNLVVWSWCSGASDNTVEGINVYLNAMSALESAYPNVTFVYMTGHLDGTGTGGTLYRNNNLIRTYCSEHNKVLYDFADIESYDPSGVYYPNDTDSCGWCYTWCASHTCGTCVSCAHSHCFNCYRKGQAFWWLLAELMD